MLATVLACLWYCSNGVAQDQPVPSRTEQLWREFETTAKQIRIQPIDGDLAYKLDPKPLFQFAQRGVVHGQVYVWHDKRQRLAMVGTIGSIPLRTVESEFLELHLLRSADIEPFVMGGYSNQTWQPSTEDLTPRPLPDSPTVAPTASRRMIQLRGLARRFAGTMVQDGQTHHLRLLPQPLYRYPDNRPELDGALFAMVFDLGTDPEILLRIESTPAGGGQPGWTYQPIRFTWRAVTLSLDNDQVWNRDELTSRDDASQTTAYLTGLRRRIP